MNRALKIFFGTNFAASLRYSLHYFRFADALRLPFLVAWGCRSVKMKGKITPECKVTTGLIRLGYNGLGTQDRRSCRTLWELEGEIVLKGKVGFGKGSRISVGGRLSLDDGFNITGGSTIICNRQINFGKDCLLSWDILVMDTDFHKILDKDGNMINQDSPVLIGDRVWIGCRSTILKGASIPSDSVIAASSVITRSLTEPNCVYGGTDGGRVLKEDISWSK